MSMLVDLAKCASASKNLESRLLNLAGFQVARSIASRAAYHTRTGRRPHSEEARKIQRHGFVVIEDFLSPERFERVREEALALLDAGGTRGHEHGRNLLEQADILANVDDCPALRALMADSRVRELIESAERRPLEPLEGHRVVERLTQRAGDSPDREASLHTDTFFHNHKLWLYLDDVTPECGPLTYVPGSHHLSYERARYQYAESIGTNRGSRRITEEELAATGLEEVAVTCRANTLVIANTTGFHRRRPGVPGNVRLAIQFSYRYNPFFPAWMNTERFLSRRNPVVARVFPRP